MKKYLLIAFLLLVVPTAQATTFTWDFGFGGTFLAFDPSTGDDFHFGSDATASTATVVYDDVAQTLVASIAGIGDVVDSSTGAVIVTGTAFNYSVNYSGVTGDPLAPNLVTTIEGVGSYSIANVGNIDGIAGNDSVSGQIETHMNLLGGDTLLAQVTGEGIKNAAWFNGIGDVLVNGSEANALFNATGGDNDFHFGTLRADLPADPGVGDTEVPEPITAALLGLGVIGGAIKRKKSQ